MEKTISGEEFIKMREAQLPIARKELNDFLDSMVKDGKYHCTVVAELIGEAANLLHVGYDVGYYNGQLEFIEEQRIKLKELHKFTDEGSECADMYYNGMRRGLDEVQGFLTDKECEITGIDEEELED